MTKATSITCLFVDIGGVLHQRLSRERAAEDIQVGFGRDGRAA
jgi:hypothetical protein